MSNYSGWWIIVSQTRIVLSPPSLQDRLGRHRSNLYLGSRILVSQSTVTYMQAPIFIVPRTRYGGRMYCASRMSSKRKKDPMQSLTDRRYLYWFIHSATSSWRIRLSGVSAWGKSSSDHQYRTPGWNFQQLEVCMYVHTYCTKRYLDTYLYQHCSISSDLFGDTNQTWSVAVLRGSMI